MSARDVYIFGDPDAPAIKREDIVAVDSDAPVLVATGDPTTPFLPVRSVVEKADGTLVMEL